MADRIENYALISDCQASALISKSGSMDWLCLPAFDSRACFAALLGNEDHGFWKICPEEEFRTERRYQGSTMILETTFETATGKVKLVDCMAVEDAEPTLLRLVEGLEGEVSMHMDYVVRFDYGSIIPWLRRTKDGHLLAIGGPDSLELQTTFPVETKDQLTTSRFVIKKGERQTCALIWRPSNLEPRGHQVDSKEEIEQTRRWWERWISQCSYEGEYKDMVVRSLLTLKSLIYHPTGGIVAAPTTSLPETIGGERNWDYRYSWVRDSTFMLYALLSTGFIDEAKAWRSWLVRAVAGTPSQVHIMYGIRGERRLDEKILPWLPGYENSRPVRTGNDAYRQRQLDIFGELMDTLYLACRNGLEQSEAAWDLQTEAIKFLETEWDQPDEGIWEVRGGRQHFVHSKVMAWVAVDRAIRMAERFNLPGPVERWKILRKEIYETVCKRGFNPNINSFTQTYESENVDASLLMLSLVGFIDPTDPRMQGTIRRIEEELFDDGLILRYRNEATKDGLSGQEGAFLTCSFWLVDNYVLQGEHDKAVALFEKLLGLANDVGLFAEEYDTTHRRQLGNFPQALSHITMVNSAMNLSQSKKAPARDRRRSHSEDNREPGP